MKTQIITSILLLAFILSGCSNTEIPPGIYMSNDPADFPLPTSGYTVYIVGETHGNKEAKMVFQTYLQSLYKEAGVRDVILEEDQGHEADANAYVLGQTDQLSDKLCLRADILGQIREFNASLPDDEQVRVHLVDVDSPLATIHTHLAELHARLGPAGEAIPFPDLDEFSSWRSAPIYELIDTLRNAAEGQPDIINGLNTVQLSLEWYYLGNRLEIRMPRGMRKRFAPLREDVMTQNIQYVLSHLNGKPVLAFFGVSHAMKNTGEHDLPVPGFKGWAHRLRESGVNVYSLAIEGVSGRGYWHKEAFNYEVQGNQRYDGTEGYRFADGTSIISLFNQQRDKEILYVDLRAEENANIQLPSWHDPEVPIGQVYDGLIIFKEFTAMEDACPQ